VAKAERVDTGQLELEFASKLAELDRLAGTTGMAKDEPTGPAASDGADDPGPGKRRGHSKGGRRELRDLGLDEQRLELTDPFFEELVAKGGATRAGFEESSRLAWNGKGVKVLVVARVKYRVVDKHGVADTPPAPVPPELVARCMAAPSLLAHIVVAKHCDGLPLHRLEAILARNAFCMATDATGVRILPERDPNAKDKRQPCRRGQMFVQLADRDHIIFSDHPRGTSEVVKELFADYEGFVLADAASIFNCLFGNGGRDEVGCWSHARRKFWEAAQARSEVAREALARIARIFELDASWKDKPHGEIRRLRQTLLKPHVTGFLDWASAEFERVKDQRGDLRSALGYAHRNRDALQRFLTDGRLPMTNNVSERELRGVAVGRKAWLFSGSDDHAESAAALMSLIASARLHDLDPERFLRDLIRVVPHWTGAPRLALTPKHWAKTRALLDQAQLAAEYGHLDLPTELPHLAAKEQSTTD
jgi:transposase